MKLNESELFDRYFNGGAFSLPFLLKFTCPNCNTLCFIANTESVWFEGELYRHASFEYNPPDTSGKGANLRISGIDNGLVEFVENADENYRLSVVGVIAEGGEIQKVKQFTHFYGTVSYTETKELNFELGTDDRLEMTFPPYKFDSETNKGNA
ncbi:MAG: hypothetical protein PUJ82_13805 [Spirochaetales bacterium]|nr:hypothetical protein [Spirochaetales bacterium]MDY5914606.1 hypothetical protein [Treponema sp.]